MADVLIPDVDDAVIETLTRRAACVNQSLEEFARNLVIDHASTLDDTAKGIGAGQGQK